MGPYSVLAKYYDKFTADDCKYDEWGRYLRNVAESCGAKEIVDLACGTGKMTKLLVDAGYKVIGVDGSGEMLNLARGKCRADFVCQDMRKLRLAHPTDMAVCVNDGVNYLKSAELPSFFSTVASQLCCGAPFVFDVSSEYKLTRVVANNVFYLDDETETLLWTNKLRPDSVKMELALFVRDSDGKYVRRDETHVQYVHTQAQIKRALSDSGFRLVEVTDSYGGKPKAQSLRLTFFAVKE